MDGMLKRGEVLIARNMESAAVIEDMLGEGAQAEVYRARIGDAHYALKWYRPEYLAGDQRLWERLKVAINSGTPAEQFLWPFDLVSYPRSNIYGGYLMPIKTPDFVSMVDLLRRQAEPSFRVLSIVGSGWRTAFSSCTPPACAIGISTLATYFSTPIREIFASRTLTMWT
jgi:eukaryotic-like serine/threonine-protein kinase